MCALTTGVAPVHRLAFFSRSRRDHARHWLEEIVREQPDLPQGLRTTEYVSKYLYGVAVFISKLHMVFHFTFLTYCTTTYNIVITCFVLKVSCPSISLLFVFYEVEGVDLRLV